MGFSNLNSDQEFIPKQRRKKLVSSRPSTWCMLARLLSFCFVLKTQYISYSTQFGFATTKSIDSHARLFVRAAAPAVFDM
jgi:hypothetical protein